MAAVSQSSRSSVQEQLPPTPPPSSSSKTTSDKGSRKDGSTRSRLRFSSSSAFSAITDSSRSSKSNGSKSKSSRKSISSRREPGFNIANTPVDRPSTAIGVAPTPPSQPSPTTQPPPNFRRHINSSSTSLSGSSVPSPSPTKSSRSKSLLALAVATIDRTQNALAKTEQKIRPRQSVGRLSVSSDSLSTPLPSSAAPSSPLDQTVSTRSGSTASPRSDRPDTQATSDQFPDNKDIPGLGEEEEVEEDEEDEEDEERTPTPTTPAEQTVWRAKPAEARSIAKSSESIEPIESEEDPAERTETEETEESEDSEDSEDSDDETSYEEAEGTKQEDLEPSDQPTPRAQPAQLPQLATQQPPRSVESSNGVETAPSIRNLPPRFVDPTSNLPARLSSIKAVVPSKQQVIPVAAVAPQPNQQSPQPVQLVQAIQPVYPARPVLSTQQRRSSRSIQLAQPIQSVTQPAIVPAPPIQPAQTVQLPQGQVQQAVVGNPPSYARPYTHANPNLPPPIRIPRVDNKMHQTSSRLLRMTDDDRPFTRDFKDLFSTLVVSLLPLTAHRIRLTKIENTFLSEDAINNLGSLKFSQSNRMPDPKDPSRIVTTTTTTTFSMAKDMARSICQRFLEARFIESADGKLQQIYTMKGSVWQLTPKGISILDRFCARNGIQQRHVTDLIGNNTTQLVILERDTQTDKILNDRATVDVIFRRFIGVNGLNVKSSVSSADSDSLNDYKDGLTGVKMASERKVMGKTYRDSFTGRAAVDWLMDCCTTVDRREANELASLFVEHGLVEAIQPDRSFQGQLPGSHLFQPTKNAIYQMTAKGRDLVNGATSRGRSSEGDGSSNARSGIARDSNTQRLDKILNDAALRLLFRENLRDTHCEENLSFYLDVDDFVRNCRQAIRAAQKSPGTTSMDGIKEIMAQAYGIYNAFLAPGSPCELNIDHQLRNNLATRMTKAVGQDGAMIETLQEVTSLFEDAQNAVFKLMASDSVPKFLRHPKYEYTLRNYDFDAIMVGSNRIERSQSRSNRK